MQTDDVNHDEYEFSKLIFKVHLPICAIIYRSVSYRKKYFSSCFLHISNWVFIENTLNAHYLKWNVNCTLNLLTAIFSSSLSTKFSISNLFMLLLIFCVAFLRFYLSCLLVACAQIIFVPYTHSLRYYAWHFLLCTTDGKWTHCNTFALCSLSSLYFFWKAFFSFILFTV